MNNNRGMKSGVTFREGYETKTGLEAINRAGKCPQLKGHVHEILFKDKFNVTPTNVLKGKHAYLTKSTTARMKDVIVKADGKVVGHYQLKDVVSKSGINQTAKKINDGYYRQTKVLGTEETVQKLVGKTKQHVESSGISSNTTRRIADKALGTMPRLSALGTVAKCGGVSGAMIGAGVEAATSAIEVVRGDKDVSDALIDVGAATIKGGVTGASSAVAGSLTAGAVGAGVSALAATSVGTAVAGTAVGAVAIAGAPIVAAFVVAAGVGSFFSELFD